MASHIIREAAKKGIHLYLKGDTLAFKAPKGAMSEDFKNAIAENKEEIIRLLKSRESAPQRTDTHIEKLDRPDGKAPTSFAQQRLWVLEQIDGSSAHYNLPGALRLEGVLDVQALNQTFTSIVERHESLRTCFSTDENGQVIQVIQAAVPFVLPMTDLSGLNSDERQRQLAELMEEDSHRVFNLSRDLMLRAHLIKLTDREHVILVTMHHIAADGWSMSILINEFSALYSAYVQDQENPLTPLPIQYADYARWQRNWLKGEVLDRQLGYWEKQLAGLPLVHGLPLDHPRPAVQTFSGNNYGALVDPTTSRAFNQLCRAHGATLFMGLHAAFNVLLSRYSNETDIVVGTPIANREQAEVEGLIGFFNNTLVLRGDLSGQPSFVELLQQSKSVLLDAYAHQQVPFEKIVERLQPERNLSHSALFQIMLALQNTQGGSLDLPGLTLSAVGQNGGGVEQYDLSLNIVDTEKGLYFGWGYNTDLFERKTIAGMAEHLTLLLKALVAEPEQNVFKIDLLTEQERQQLLVEWNNTENGYSDNRCFHELFEAQADSDPDTVAVIFEDQQITYGELNGKANQLAWYLAEEQRIKPDTLVGICVERSLDMVIGILAILKAGGAYVPLDPEYPEARLAYMLEDANLDVVLTQSHLCGKLSVATTQAVILDSDPFKQQLNRYPLANPGTESQGVSPNNLAYIIYTSGSTGKPKGVMIEHASLVSTLLGLSKTFQVTPEDSSAYIASVAFDIALFELFLPLINGGRSIIIRREALYDFDALASELKQCTLLHAVPSLMAEICAYKGAHPSSFACVRKVFVGGDYVPPSLLSKLATTFSGADVVELYGPTESTILSTYAPVTEELLNHANAIIGKALPNRFLCVLNAGNTLAPVGVAGELHIGGTGLARGYLSRAELTDEKFIPNPFRDAGNVSSSARLYKTGDLVRWLPDGNLEFLGRIDHQVKIRGFRIELGEIESTLNSCTDVVDAIVVAREADVGGDKHLVAYVVTEAVDLRNDSKQSATARQELIEKLRHHLNRSLPDYMVPGAFVLLAQWPLTPNGKVDRKALPEPDVSRQQEVYLAPRTETEKVLCEIWQEVLGVERVGITDNFFRLGGHSLLVMQVIARLQYPRFQERGISLTARQLFSAPRLSDLAELLDGATAKPEPAFQAPGNLIPQGCESITPEMLPLVKLTEKEIARIVEGVPGGAANVQDIYPLVPLQEGILFHHTMSTGGDPYVLPVLFKINGEHAVNNFIDALQFIVNRHDVLRTAIFWKNLPTPVQVVCRWASLPVTWLDLGNESENVEDLEAEMHARCEPRRQKMDLGRAPLIQLQIARDGNSEKHFVLLQYHHIISDHVGLEIIQDELALYQAGQAEKLLTPIPYREFVAHAQYQALHHDAESFFTRTLGDVEEPTTPFNLIDVAGDGSRIVETRAGVPNEVSEAVRRVTKKLAMSPAALFHAAWAMVIAGCSGRDDVVFGTVLSGRLQGTVGAENMLGVFINTLPLRVKLHHSSAIDLIRQVQNSLTDLLPYEQASLALAQHCSGVPTGSPLFSAMLNYRHSAAAETRGVSDPAPADRDIPDQENGMEVISWQERTNYPFNISVDDFGKEFALDVQVDNSVSAERVLAYMQTAIAMLVKALEFSPQQPVTALSILPEIERHQLLAAWNDTAVEYPADKCIHQQFEMQVEVNPDAVAVVFESQQLTYGELNRQANQLAHYLINEKQVTPDTPVGICIERSLEMVIGILAVLKTGGAYVPLDPEYPSARLQYMLEDAGLNAVLTQSHLLGITPVSDTQAVCLDDSALRELLRRQPTHNPDASALGLTPKHLAYVIYTSGSTGNPKGVMVEHRALVNRIDWMNRQYGSTPSDRILQKTPFSFDVSVWEFVWPLTVGAGLVLAAPGGHKDPAYLSALIRGQRITKLHFVPSMLGSMLTLGDLPQCTSLRQVFCSGEALALHHIEQFQAKCPWAELHNLYGPTEAAIDVSYWDCSQSRADLGSVPIGRPIHNVQLFVLDRNLNPAPACVAGELHIGGVGLARGYLHRAELTAEKFITNPFHDKSNPSSSGRLYKTGDLVRWLPDGNLEFLGRIDHQVKVRGFRIELGEIENALTRHDEVKEAIVLARNTSTDDKRLVAYVVTDAIDVHDGSEEGAATRHRFIEALRRHLSQTLPDYMVPSAFVLLKQLPLTPNGKADRKALPEPDFAEQQAAYVAPRTEVEKRLCEIWREVLGIEKVGITDNFFQLGGHSISALQLVSSMNLALNANISVRDIFIAPTIEALVAEADFTRSSLVYQQLEAGLRNIEALQQSILNDPQQRRHLPENYEDFYPLSTIQQSMVFFAQAQPEEPLYHDQFPYVIPVSDFNFAAFQQAVDLLSQNHTILRSSFDVTNFDMPLQVVHTKPIVAVDFDDVSHLPVDIQQQKIQSCCQEDLRNKFIFQCGQPLWRVHAFTLNPGQVCFILSFQHAILDGWSVNAMVAELMRHYIAIDKGLPPTGENEPRDERATSGSGKPGYKDYVAINLARSASENTIQFWQAYLKDYNRMKLPFNYSGRPISDEPGMKMLRADIDEGLLQSLQQRARRDGYSIKEVCLAAHVHTLSLLSADEEILTGVVTHDRPALDGAEKILGCFLNTIPMRLPAGKSGQKPDLLNSVRQYLNRTKEHELFLGDIAAAVGERNVSGNPLFDILFNFTDFPSANVYDEALAEANEDKKPDNARAMNGKSPVSGDAAGVVIKSSEMTNTLLDIEAHKYGEQGIAVQVKYSPKYFHTTEVETILSLYMSVLKSFVDDRAELPSTRLISAINEAGGHGDFNQTDRAYQDKKTLHRLFEEQVQRTPEAVALRQHGKTMSYGQLDQRANRIARLLLSKGVNPGDHVGLVFPRAFDLIAAIFGILKAGAAYVPMEPGYPLARRQAIAESAGLSGVLIDPSVRQADDSTDGLNYICLDDAELAQCSAENPGIDKDAGELAYIIYTSGSTGLPKGVRIAHHSAVNLMSWVNREFSIRASDVMLCVTSVSFDLSVYDIFGVLSAGGSIVIAEQAQVRDPQQLIELIKSERVTFWDSVPTTLNHLIDEMSRQQLEQPLPTLRLVFLSGDWIPVQLPGKVKTYFPNARVISLGGATEGTVWSNYYPVPDNAEHRGTIPYGKPIDNNRFYILDAGKNPVINGVVGELYIAGVGVADGYQNDPQRTSESFFDDPFVARDINGQPARMYKTGDLGRLLPCGNMELHGRVDHQIKLRGFRIELGEIEAVIYQYHGIKEAVVSLISADANGELVSHNQYLAAYIVAATDTALSIDCLAEYLAGRLPEYMIPKVFMQLDQLPLTQNGKVDRKALPEPEISESQKSFVAPRTETEKLLSDIWQEVLDVERIGATDNFFHLGGHSLMATRLVARINQAFNVTLPLEVLFTGQTVESVAKALLELDCEPGRPALVPVSRDQDLPASYAQQRLWLLDKIDGGSAHYNIPGALKLTGTLDVQALNKSFTSILERHESLRTCFTMTEEEAGDEGQTLQFIQAPAPYVVPVCDLSQLASDARQSQLAEIMAEEFNRAFDLSRDLMLRAQLIKLDLDEHVLLVNMHHIASDGWSMPILINEFSQLYRAYIQGEDNPLKPLAVQYADYAFWQRNWLQGEVLERQLEYWTTQLANLPPVHSLPLDRPRPPVQTFVGATHVSHIDAGTSAALNAFCQQQSATLFMGLQAAFAVLLSRYSNETDIVMGSPIANREQAEVAGLIGFFVNTLVLRSDLSDNPSFAGLLGQSKRMLLDAYAHQQVPFEQIVERLQPERDLSHSALFQVMLVLQNNEAGTLEIPGLTLSPVAQDGAGTAKYDLTLNVFEHEQGLALAWEYNIDLFEHSTIARMATHFDLLLQALLATPEKDVFDTGMLSEREHQQLLVEYTDTGADYPRDKCIHELFEAQVEAEPNAVAVTFENQLLTYGELNEKANRLAHYLINERNVKPDTLVGICVERSTEMLVGILAVLKAGGAYVPLDPDYPPARLEYMLNDAGLTTVLTQNRLRESSPVTGGQAICLDDKSLQQKLQQQPAHNPRSPELTPNHLAYVIYTSGSTGNPKGVMIEHRNTVAFLSWAVKTFDKKQLECVLASTSICFDLSVFEMFSPLVAGGSLLIVKNVTALQSTGYPQKISLINTVPSAIEALMAGGGIPESVKTVNLAGEPLKQKIVDQLYLANIDAVYDLYGPSEDTTYSTFVLRTPQGEASIGKPIDNCQVYLLDKALQPVAQGIAGEMYIGGAGLARGYLNRPDLTEEKFISNPFHDKSRASSSERLYKTGDLARWLPDGNLEFLGRIDHQVKVRGFRIELGEIEHRLLTHTDVKDVIVLAKETPASGDKRLVAYVVPKLPDVAVNFDDDSEQSIAARHELTEALRQHLRQTVPDYMVPGIFVLLASLPLTPNGKVDRKALPEPDESVRQNVYIAPRTEAEKVLCELWQRMLGVQRVGIADNFFHLGGDSLRAVRFVGAAKKVGFTFTVANVMQSPTVESLAGTSRGFVGHPSRNQELIIGEVPLSTAQQLFLDTTLDEPNWGNAVRYFDLHSLDKIAFENSLFNVLRHHDALRAKFVRTSKGWKQIIVAPDELNLSVEYLDYSSVPEEEKVDAIDHFLFSNNGEMDLLDPPLVKVKLFYLGGERGYVGRINIHHLLMDGYSADIVFDDWLECYRAAVTGENFTFPEKTASTRAWVTHLIEYTNSAAMESEVDYWLNLPWNQSVGLPVDHPERIHENTAGSNRDLPVSLSKEHTSALVDLAARMGVPLVDILIAALAKTLADYAQEHGGQGYWIPLRVLDAGRGFDLDLDVSRTVGWLCVQRTLMLRVDREEELRDTVVSTSDQIRGMPNKGLGLELIRCYHKDNGLRKKLESLVKTELFLNFHGILNHSAGEGEVPFSALLDKGKYKGQWISPKNINNEKFTCNARIANGELHAEWRYSENLYERESMIKLTDQLLDNLIAIAGSVPSGDKFEKGKAREVEASVSQA